MGDINAQHYMHIIEIVVLSMLHAFIISSLYYRAMKAGLDYIQNYSERNDKLQRLEYAHIRTQPPLANPKAT